MQRLLIPALCLIFGATAFAGCGSSSKKSSNATPAASTPAPAAGTGGTPAGGAATAGVAVTMQNIQFSPKATPAKVGQTVTWTNKDSVDHNVTVTGGPQKFTSKNFGAGGTYSVKLTKPGTINYVCTIHPGMGATLTVTK